MSWVQKLYSTHVALSALWQAGDTDSPVPESHTTAKTHIEMVLDGNGNFRRAAVIARGESTTIIPCTERSAVRSGKNPVPHPLCDSLQYLATDFRDFGGEVTSGFAKIAGEPHESFRKQLQTWVDASPHPKTKAVLAYITQGRVVKDLVDSQILPLGEDGKIVKTRPDTKSEAPPIWSALPQNQTPDRAVVRWRVEISGQAASGTWEDQSLIENWADYYRILVQDGGLCMATGQAKPLTYLHPGKLRNEGDKARLISANDSSGFTFRGRFTDDDGRQACGVSYEASQKVHSTLRWLIARQGYKNGSQVFVSWAVSGKDIPQPLPKEPEEGFYDWLEEAGSVGNETAVNTENPLDHARDVGQSFALKLNKYIAGYEAKLDPTDEIVVMGLDSATPGRLSITYYRELPKSEFLERLKNWHLAMAWPQRFQVGENANARGKGKTRTVWRMCAPAPRAIAEAAFGRRLDDKLKSATVERLLPCIVDGQSLPADLVESCVRRAANRPGMERWEWEHTLGVACAMFKGFFALHHNPAEEGGYEMALEPERNSRDYLYGRLLAIAEYIEEIALWAADKGRPTTAARLMQRFSDYPFSTWRTIEISLQPYVQSLQASEIGRGFLNKRLSLLDEVYGLFQGEDFQSDNRLTGEFLLGYHCQRRELHKSGKDNKTKIANESETKAETEGEA